MVMKYCARCGAPVDRSACGEQYAIFTVSDDRGNSKEKYEQRRHYFCELCSLRLELGFIKKNGWLELEIATKDLGLNLEARNQIHDAIKEAQHKQTEREWAAAEAN